MTLNFGSSGIEPAEPTTSLQLSPARGEGVFGEAAERLCGAVSLLLGWRPGEFWEATPAEVATALRATAAEQADAPDARTIEELRRRFPDD